MIICGDAVRFDAKQFSQKLSQYTSQKPEMVYQRIFGSWVPDHYEKGEYDTQEFYRRCTQRVKADISFEKFCLLYKQCLSVNVDGCDALIIQAGQLVKEVIPDDIPVVYTCDIGVLKPSKQLLVQILKKLGENASDCVYRDSDISMQSTAKKLGFNL